MTDVRPVRFVVAISASWEIGVSCAREPAWTPQAKRPMALVRMAVGKHRYVPGPAWELHAPHVEHDGVGSAAGPDDIVRILEHLRDRDASPAEIKAFGHYLFDALLGPELWAEITQKTEAMKSGDLELALSWSEHDMDLHRLNWELMCSNDDFLAAGTSKLRVALTRLIKTDDEPPQPLSVPPRALFVIGTSINEEQIRPAAELHALIKQARAGRAMSYRVLERAKPIEIRRVIAEFKPEIVHFISHGGVDDEGNVFLVIKGDEGDADAERYADQLKSDLRAGGAHPTIVVLSACLTAGSQMYLAGAHETAPLAATLVKSGIPIVIGMAGRVADITSRLFARQFGQSIIRGEPLVKATGYARAAAFADPQNPVTTADWALPAVFVSSAVDEGYRPVDADETNKMWQLLEQWMTSYGFTREPVFCGREEFFPLFHELFESAPPPGQGGGARRRVLGIFVKDQGLGYGRTRLLEEFAAHALRDGHLPVLLTFEEGKAPNDLRKLAHKLGRAITKAREILGVGDAASSQLSALRNGETAQLEPTIVEELDDLATLTGASVRLAVRSDLETLLKDARARIPFFEASQGTVVVLLDDIDQYGPLVELLFKRDELLSPDGFGRPGAAVPVVMTWSLSSAGDSFLGKIVAAPQALGWLAVAELRPFDTGEDLMAYQTVLLNPFTAPLQDDDAVLARPWAFDPEAGDELRKKYYGRYQRRMGGMPNNFHEEIFTITTEDAAEDRFLIEASDTQRLADLTGDR